MQNAEAVTFGKSGIERAAELRADDAALARLAAEAGACVLPVWRGKPLVDMGAGSPKLALLGTGDPLLKHGTEPFIFLGLDAGKARFAADVSGWEPAGAALPEAGFFDATRQPAPGAKGAEPAFTELRGVMAALSREDATLAATARALTAWHHLHGFCAACGAESAPILAGWQRRCPSCGRRHFPRTDPVVIMLITQGNSLLVGRSPGWPEGMYSLLAGFVEPGETMEDAVRREVAEETGVPVGEVGYLASQPWPYPSSLMIGCRGEAQARAITLDPVELDDALWLSREELLEVFAGRHAHINPAREGSIARFLMQNWLADRLE